MVCEHVSHSNLMNLILLLFFSFRHFFTKSSEIQVLIGDIAAANATHREFFGVWEKYGVMPERYASVIIMLLFVHY